MTFFHVCFISLNIEIFLSFPGIHFFKKLIVTLFISDTISIICTTLIVISYVCLLNECVFILYLIRVFLQFPTNQRARISLDLIVVI